MCKQDGLTVKKDWFHVAMLIYPLKLKPQIEMAKIFLVDSVEINKPRALSILIQYFESIGISIHNVMTLHIQSSYLGSIKRSFIADFVLRL